MLDGRLEKLAFHLQSRCNHKRRRGTGKEKVTEMLQYIHTLLMMEVLPRVGEGNL